MGLEAASGKHWLFAEVKASQRANSIHIAWAQDIESSFNGRALQGIRFDLPGVKIRARKNISLSMHPNSCQAQIGIRI
jgi:hypothetical protein